MSQATQNMNTPQNLPFCNWSEAPRIAGVEDFFDAEISKMGITQKGQTYYHFKGTDGVTYMVIEGQNGGSGGPNTGRTYVALKDVPAFTGVSSVLDLPSEGRGKTKSGSEYIQFTAKNGLKCFTVLAAGQRQ